MHEFLPYAVLMGLPGACDCLTAWKAWRTYRAAPRKDEADEPALAYVIIAFLFLCPVAAQLIAYSHLASLDRIRGSIYLLVLGVLLLPAGLWAIFSRGTLEKRLIPTILLFVSYSANASLLLLFL